MKTYLFILILCLSVKANSQPNWNWVNSNGEVSLDEYTTANCTDANGISYLAGIFQHSIIFGNDTLSSPNGGIFVAKIDSSGNPIWARMLGGNNALEINSMTLDDSGHVYLAGALGGTVIFGNDTIVNIGPYKFVFVGKFDSDLNLIWYQQATGTFENVAIGVAVNSSSEVYITGRYDSSATFGSTFLQGGPGNNIFVAKYGSNGNNLWAQSSSSSTTVVVNGITCDKFDHVCIAGYFRYTLTFGSHTITAPPNGGVSILLVQYDGAGTALWAKNSGGFPSSGYANCISTDSLGNFYCAGYFNSPIMIFENDTLVNEGFDDIFIAKYSNLGDLIWVKRAGGQAYDDAYSIKTDRTGNTYMTGFFKGLITFGTTFLFGPNQELYVAKYDSNGNPLWAVSATGDLNETGNGIGFDSFNNVYINGDFSSPTSTFGQLTITNTDIFTGSNDIFFARLSELPTAIKEMEYSKKENLLIYPNPGSGLFRIMNEFVANSILRIYDVQGRVINEFSLNNDMIIDLKNISSGMYFLQLTSKKEIRSGKLVVQ